MVGNNTIILVPSAKFIDVSLSPRFGEINSCLAPVHGITVLEMNYYAHWHQARLIVLLIEQGKEQVEKTIRRLGQNVVMVDVTGTKNLTNTIEIGLKYLQDNDLIDLPLFINYGDTYLDNAEIFGIDGNQNMAVYSKVNDSRRWTVFTTERQQMTLFEKVDELIEDIPQFNAFVGLFRFHSGQTLMEQLEHISLKESVSERFYAAIAEFYAKNSMELFETDNWFDFGHATELESARTIITPRFFNQIAIDRKRGIVTKTSEDVETLSHEITWYQRLPSELAHVAPRLFSASLFPRPSYSIEYFPYETLHELFVFGNLLFSDWYTIIDLILSLTDEMHAIKRHLHAGEMKKAQKAMYIEKTINRVEQFEKKTSLNLNEEIWVNDICCPPVMDLLSQVNAEILHSADESLASVIHGDLCFSNILYNHPTKTIRLIDPRGLFGHLSGVWGDPYYDYAKLSHSVNSFYDVIIADMFTISQRENEITLDVIVNDNQRMIGDLFLSLLSHRYINIKHVRIIESLLFLSMTPLHADYPKRQTAMFAVGINLLNQCMEEMDE